MLGPEFQDDNESLKTQSSCEETPDNVLLQPSAAVDIITAMEIDQVINEFKQETIKPTNIHDDVNFQLLLKTFYQRLFPFKDFYKWLSYGAVHKQYFMNREFSFTLASDTYIRFKSFQNDQDLKNEIIRLCPVKIDIGAVYNFPPAHKKTTSAGFIPQERELVFDIDMTDYDEIRTCCSGANICHVCWQFMTLAIKIIDRALEDDFGFKHRLWIYSGRRGVHCWISDERARKLTQEARRSIISYLEVIKGGEHTEKKVMLRSQLHPSLRIAYKVLEKNFEKIILQDMDVLRTKESCFKMLQLIPDDEIRKNLTAKWDSSSNEFTSRQKWDHIVSSISVKEKRNLVNTKRDIILQYTYPRLDSNVSIGLNHLLKSPFCIHPKTGRVCVPIDVARCDKFDPFEVPTLNLLIQEIDEYEKSNVNDLKKTPDYAKTSLKPYIEHFKSFLSGMASEVSESLHVKREEAEKSMEF